MRNASYLLLVTLLMLSIPGSSSAQFTIKQDRNTEIVDKNRKFDTDFNVDDRIQNEYFDRAAYHAEKLRIRKERNTLEIKGLLQGSLQQYENWQESGENSVSGLGTFYMRHQYAKDKFSTDLTLDLKYGINVVDDQPFKNQDLMKLGYTVSRAMSENWSYSGVLGARSQFANGYKSRTDHTLKSTFMAPGYLDLSLGFTYSKKGSPFKITLSPISGNMIFVLDEEINETSYGLEEGKKTLNQAGPSINVNFDKKFGEKKWAQYRSTLYSFSNLSTVPTVRWENTIDLNLTKHITTSFYWVMYYQKSASTALQYQYSATIGLSYNYKNK